MQINPHAKGVTKALSYCLRLDASPRTRQVMRAGGSGPGAGWGASGDLAAGPGTLAAFWTMLVQASLLQHRFFLDFEGKKKINK